MILSRLQIEAIGRAVVQDYEERCGSKPQHADAMNQSAFPIEEFATDYLGLEVSMTELSSDGSICGLTAYTDTEYLALQGETVHTIPLHKKQVLIDSHLAGPFQMGRRRFTLAHECAHQILFAMEDEAARRARQKTYAKRSEYSLRELKSKEDWNEWQANALAAAVLIPVDKLKKARCQMGQTRPVKCYGAKLDPEGHADVSNLCNAFGVSQSAMLIRLRQIGTVTDRPISEYWSDPLEIWP